MGIVMKYYDNDLWSQGFIFATYIMFSFQNHLPNKNICEGGHSCPVNCVSVDLALEFKSATRGRHMSRLEFAWAPAEK